MIKSRFWQQPETMACGPIAILNALRWLGYGVSLKRNFKQICNECGYTKRKGTAHHKLSHMLRTIAGLKIIRPRMMTIPRFKNFLRGRQTAIIMSFRTGRRGKGHCCLVIKQHGKLKFVNKCSKQLYDFVDDIELDVLLRSHGGFPAIWFLEKI